MVHTFDVEIAQQYGINAAVLLQYINFCCESNKANGRHFHDGHTWTYNTNKAFLSLFPYLTEHKIRTALNKLLEAGIIIKGKYNIKGYDQTNWYAITDAGYTLLKKCQMETQKMSDGNLKNVRPIPVNIPVNKKIYKKEFESEFETFWERYPNKFNREQTYKNFVKTAKRDGADTVLRALDIYLGYIRQKGISEDYIARSTNFVGQKALYKGYLEMTEIPNNVTVKQYNPCHESSDELFRRLAEEGGFEDDRDYTNDSA
ncbi:MAG: hypothetical protein MRZ66_05920 [Clostridiales bacterium]|nr:hypothetical protein [Clostridiales bacterium]